MKKKEQIRVTRTDEELLQILKEEIQKLKEFYYLVYYKGDLKYLGDIAGKLRILVIDEGGKRHKALLLELMDKFDCHIPYVHDGPPLKDPPHPGDKLSLREFLDLRAYIGRTQSGELTDMTKKEVIKKWSNQSGSAHQDWEIEEDIDSFLNSGNMINVNGLPIHALELRATTKVVLNIADKFLNEIQK